MPAPPPPPQTPIPLNLPKLITTVKGATCHPALSLQMKRLGGGSGSSSSNTHSVGDGSSSPSSSSPAASSSSNVRSLMANDFIPKGSVLATIPASLTLQGATAHDIVRIVFGGDKYRKLMAFSAAKEGADKRKAATKKKAADEERKDADANSQQKKRRHNSFADRSDELYVALSSRNSIIMLASLVAARVYNAQQQHLLKLKNAAAAKNGVTKQQQTQQPHVLPTFASLRLAAPPPQWLLMWCKYGLPAKHFAAGLSVAEAQTVRLEKVERRRLNVIEDASDKDGGNMGMFPSPIPTAGYLPPLPPQTLADDQNLVGVVNGNIHEHIASRMPDLVHGTGLPGSSADVVAQLDARSMGLLEPLKEYPTTMADNVAIAGSITGGGSGSHHQQQLGGGGMPAKPLALEDGGSGSGSNSGHNNNTAAASNDSSDVANNNQQSHDAAGAAPISDTNAAAADALACGDSALVSSHPSDAVSIHNDDSNRFTSVEPFAPNRTRDLVEVVATPTMITKFMQDQPLVLSEAKQRMLVAHKYGDKAAFEELALRSAALDKQLLRPLARILLGITNENGGDEGGVIGGKEKKNNSDGVTDAADDDAIQKSAKLFDRLVSDEDDDDLSDLGPVMEDLRWAHAMLRSRAVNSCWSNIGKSKEVLQNDANAVGGGGGSAAAEDTSLVEPALIPIVDLLNHMPYTQTNATFIPSVCTVEVPTTATPAGNNNGRQQQTQQQLQHQKAFSIIATKDINAGDMISTYYGHYRQRTILFEEDPLAAAEALDTSRTSSAMAAGTSGADGRGGGAAVDLSHVPIAARERLSVAIDMKRIEDQQRWGSKGAPNNANGTGGVGSGIINDDALNEAKALGKGADPRHSRRKLDDSVTDHYFSVNGMAEGSGSDSINNNKRGTEARDASGDITRKKFSGLSDADWSWYFGFVKSEEEKGIEARKQFDKQLTRRVANMIDSRRKGRHGEYVVGVPPGLMDLHAHRARLQVEQYGGHAVFPPQRV